MRRSRVVRAFDNRAEGCGFKPRLVHRKLLLLSKSKWGGGGFTVEVELKAVKGNLSARAYVYCSPKQGGFLLPLPLWQQGY